MPSMSNIGARLVSLRAPLFIYHGSADETAPVAHADLYARALPRAVVRRLDGRDHQLNDDLSEVAADIRQLR
jgi:pimeloyl-ACP methyl ester carboxylesterase